MFISSTAGTNAKYLESSSNEIIYFFDELHYALQE